MIRTKALSVFVMVLAYCVCLTAQNELKGGSFYMPKKVHWARPHWAAPHLRIASATVLYVGRDHLFARDDCWLLKKGGQITISNGDPHDQYVGYWEPIPDGMHYRYRLVNRTVKREGESFPGTEMSGDVGAALRRDHMLELNDKLFVPFAPTNAREYDATYHHLKRMNADSNND